MPLDRLNRRDFLGALCAGALPQTLLGQGQCPGDKADFTIRIAPLTLELTPGKKLKTIGYNGSAPGPILRMAEGKEVSVDVFNDTSDPELVHWHGLHIPSGVDGSMEEGTPMVPAHACRRYRFSPRPAGTRWYHTHTMAMQNLSRATYTGQFGFLYVEPKSEPGAYDQEVFLALKEWDPYFSTQGDESVEVAYKRFSINDRALGYGEPIRVKQGQRVMLRILNASATMERRIAIAGHQFQVVAMDGNPVPVPKKVGILELGPAERIDALVEMNRPGIWVLGATDDHDRQGGLGVVIEYAGQTGSPAWSTPSSEVWSYTAFGAATPATEAVERVPLVFESKFAGRRTDKWTINGKSFPKTDPIRVTAGRRYRLVFDNRSTETHPVHLHRHSFELTKVEGADTSGIFKDVVVVGAKKQVEVDFVANNPGPTLFHCHQQMHMDYGFMTMVEYV